MANLIRKINFPKTYIFLMILMILFFIIGIIITFKAFEMSEYPELGIYNWRIIALSENDSTVNFEQAQLHYHFSSQEGSITMIPRDNLKKLIIFFPEDLTENISLELMKLSNFNSSWEKLKVDFPQHKQESDKSTILFSGDNIDDWIRVNFKLDLSPNAVFSIEKNSNWGEGTVLFDFGNKFECIRPECAFNIHNLVPSPTGYVHQVNTLIYGFNQSLNERDNPEYRFETSVKSSEVISSKNFWVSFGVSLMTGAIFSFFAILIGLLQLYSSRKR